MGNGSSKKLAKVMKITGETLKVKTPVLCSEVVKDYPGYVLLESDLVKKYGVRAKPLEHYQELIPKKIYFLVELPKLPVVDKEEEEEKNKKLARRVRSASSVPPSLLNHMSAKDRLEFLMLTRRSNSDVSKKINIRSYSGTSSSPQPETAAMQVKMRLPRAQVQKLIQENQDESELAEKIVNLCMQNSQAGNSDHDHDHHRRP